MELLNYDKEKRVSTVTLTDNELVYIHSVLGGVRSTFYKQDLNIIGIDEENLDGLVNDITKVIVTLNKRNGIKERTWEELKLKK